jgi:hypothetical protein
MHVTTRYEDAYYGIAKFQYASRWGDLEQQESALSLAVHEDRYLSAQARRDILIEGFKLEVNRHDYSEVLRLWKRLQNDGIGSDDSDTAAKLKAVVAQIERSRSSAGSYVMSGTVDEGGAWSVHLCKRNFHVGVEDGVIFQLKLKCQKGFVGFAFDPELQYQVQEKYGDCDLTLTGTPGTHFKLTQS